jgi:hypothetical protein
MRGVHRLRRFSSEYLLPLVISALVLRALIPVGFMPAAAGVSFTAMLCNVPATSARTEVLEFPGAEIPGASPAMHCDYCALPMLGAATTLPVTPACPAISLETPAAVPDAPFSRFALQRAQIPRAPPLA